MPGLLKCFIAFGTQFFERLHTWFVNTPVIARNTCRTSGRPTKFVDNSILMPPLKRDTRRGKNNDDTYTSRWRGENKDARVKFRCGRDDAIVTLVKAHGRVKTCTIEIEVAAESTCVQEIFQNRPFTIVRKVGQEAELQTSGILLGRKSYNHVEHFCFSSATMLTFLVR